MATKWDGILGSQLRDTQGEILDIKGCDISELEAGRGYVNDGHSNKLPDILGRITRAKKVFGPEDCETERERFYWNKIKAPFIFGEGILFDDEGEHRSAKAAAAILRHQHKHDPALVLKASVEGGIIERGDKDERLLKRTKLKGVAFTYSPANNATLIQGLDLKKSSSWEADEPLIKSLIPLAQTNVPSFIEVADAISEVKIRRNIEKIAELTKALTAGYGGGSPTEATGGQVLQSEAFDTKPIDTKSGGFKYITCSECGKEQPYVKFQVRCRKCSKAFPMDTLAKFFIDQK